MRKSLPSITLNSYSISLRHGSLLPASSCAQSCKFWGSPTVLQIGSRDEGRGDLLAPISRTSFFLNLPICSLWPLHRASILPIPKPPYSYRDFVPRQCPPNPLPDYLIVRSFYVHLRVPEMAATTSPYLSFGMFGFVGDCCRWICNCRVDGRVGVAAWGESSNWICGDYGFKW
jgi:hypothetical protein